MSGDAAALVDRGRGSRRVVDAVVLAALVLAAAVLRSWPLVAASGAVGDTGPLALAVGNGSGGGFAPDPRLFHPPSFGLELEWLVQQLLAVLGRLAGWWSNAADRRLGFALDPWPMVVAARGFGIVCDALTVVAAWRIGRRDSRLAAVIAATLTVASTSAIAIARGVDVDPLLVTLASWSLERMLAWSETGGRARAVVAAALTGLAAATGTIAATLVLPLGWLVFRREGRRGVKTVAWLTLVAAAAYALVTPALWIDPAAWARTLAPTLTIAPEHVLAGLGALLTAPGDMSELGAPALLALTIAPFVAWRDAARRPAVAALGLALALFLFPLLLGGAEATVATWPRIAFAAPLTAIGMAAVVTRLPQRRRRLAVTATLLVLLVPPCVTAVRAAGALHDDTREQARRWCETHLGHDRLVLSESYGPRLMDADRLAELRASDAYAHASVAWRARVDGLSWVHVVTLPLGVPEPLTNALSLTGMPPVTLEVAPHGTALTRVYYTPATFADADIVITTSAVRDRYLADPTQFATPCRLYHLLDMDAPVAARFRPGPTVSGPEIVVYRIDARARAALTRGGPLDPLWWTLAIPNGYRAVATRLMAVERQMRDSALVHPPQPRGANGALVTAPRPLATPTLPDTASVAPGARAADGDPAPWVRSLRPLYQRHVASFAAGMANALAVLGRYDGAAPFAEANLVMMPEDVASCLVASVSLAQVGRWPEARATIERTLAVLDPERLDPALELEYARTLAHTGDTGRARDIAAHLAATRPASDPIAAAARTELTRLP